MGKLITKFMLPFHKRKLLQSSAKPKEWVKKIRFENFLWVQYSSFV